MCDTASEKTTAYYPAIYRILRPESRRDFGQFGARYIYHCQELVVRICLRMPDWLNFIWLRPDWGGFSGMRIGKMI